MIKRVLKKIFPWFTKKSEDQDKQQDDFLKTKITGAQEEGKTDLSVQTESDKTFIRKGRRRPDTRKPEKKGPISGNVLEAENKWDISTFDVPPKDGYTRFHDLELPVPIMHGIFDLGFKYCTAIQAEILPKALKRQDAIGQAQTGTGKSAAFLIAIFTQFLKTPLKGRRPRGTPRALILSPTRELALQIEKDAVALSKYTRLKILSVYGGLGYDYQKNTLKNNIIDIVVATPGRLLDFKSQHIINLNKVECLVIDEADRMLDMGFIPDIRKIVNSTPPKSSRQTMFFSATLNEDVNRLAQQWTRDSFGVEIQPEHIASDSINQIVYLVTTDEKYPLLYNLITKQNLERVIIFTNRRDQARTLSDHLTGNTVSNALISGDLDQKKRIKALENFREGKIRVLVATDVASRGIHIDNISHVINYNFPNDPEHYVHRIGRTGRAGATGISISFACEEDSFYIPAIEKVLGNELKCEYPEPELLETPPMPVHPVSSSSKSSPNSSRKPGKKSYPKRTEKQNTNPKKKYNSRSKSPLKQRPKPAGRNPKGKPAPPAED